MLSSSDSPSKTCAECGGTYPIIFFAKDCSRYTRVTRTRCKGCEQARRDAGKQADRFLVKARAAVRSHAKRFGRAASDLASAFGWDVHKMAHDLKHAWGNGCPYCDRKYETMGHGIADMTFDVINPADPPYYTANTRIVCATCNKGKQQTHPSEFAQTLLCWKQWERQQEERKRNPYGPLFVNPLT